MVILIKLVKNIGYFKYIHNMLYDTLVNIVLSFLLISLIHYLYIFFSRKAVPSVPTNTHTKNKKENNDILEAINTLANAEKEPVVVECKTVVENAVVENTPINMENELDNFLKNLG